MKIGNFSIWTTASEAAEIGATHHARMWGIIPGFACDGSEFLWIPRSDALFWLEDVISYLAAIVQGLKGEDVAFAFAFAFRLGEPIKL